MISRNRTFVTVYLAGACEKQPHTVLSLIPSLQGLELKVSYLTVRACGSVGENRHGILGTYSGDGDGDNPLLTSMGTS
jgi:hypothetical protein